MNDLLIYSLAIAVIVTTITKGAIFEPVRDRLPGQFLKKLFNCPYCLAHWVAVPFAITLTGYTWYAVPIILALIAISSLSTFFLIKYIRWLDVN